MRLQLTPWRRGCVGAGLVLITTAGSLARAQQAPLPAASAEPYAPAPATAHPSPIDEHAVLEYGQYADSDHVFVETPSLRGTVSNPTAGWALDGSYLVDVVSAASADIVSTASRRWTEVRQEGELGASYKPESWGVQANAGLSDEPDYVSWSAGGAITQDLAHKNVTWLLGYSHAQDVAGRTGTPFSVFSRAIDRNALNGALTLVLERATLASFVGDVVFDSGDQSKPYRYIPLFAPGTDVPRGAPIDLVNSLRVSARSLEQLPLSRQRYAVTGRLAHRYRRATLRLDERLYVDSWRMAATTTDLRLLLDRGRRLEYGPHARVHAQSAVDFWQRAYVFGPGFQYPVLRTGDRELGPLLNLTGGLTLRVGLGPSSRPDAWVLGFELNATSTQYLDDLYLTHRISTLGSVALEADL